MDMEKLIKDVTGKKAICYIGQGHYQITENQARKLTDGFLPKPGHFRTMKLGVNGPTPSFVVGETQYEVSKCTHNGREVWCVRC